MFFFKWIIFVGILWYLWWAVTKRFIPWLQRPTAITGSKAKYQGLMSEINHVKESAGTIEKEATIERGEAERVAKEADETAIDAGKTAERLKEI